MSRLNMDFDLEEDKALEFLKYEYGIKQTTELIRFLIRQAHKKFLKENYILSPRRVSSRDKTLEDMIEKYCKVPNEIKEERIKEDKIS